jgi:hypothetical protein
MNRFSSLSAYSSIYGINVHLSHIALKLGPEARICPTQGPIFTAPSRQKKPRIRKRAHAVE